MKVTAYKTPVVDVGDDLFRVLKENLPQIHENDVVVITSKIVALCEKAVVPKGNTKDRQEKQEIVKKQAEYFTSPHSSKYHLMLTIKQQLLAVNAGVDESNVKDHYVLWPQHPQESVNTIWNWLRENYTVKHVGVIVSDSRTMPLRWGVIGTYLAHCGFLALNDQRGKPDLFGRPMQMTQINVAEALAVAAVYEMGETDESTPLAVVSDASFVQFQDRLPSESELASLTIELEDDVYAPILTKAEWEKGEG